MTTDTEVMVVEQQEQKDTELEARAARRLAEAQQDFDFLKDRFNTAYANAIAGLDQEREELAREWQSIETMAKNLEHRLPAQVIVCQYEAAKLTLEGKDAEAVEMRQKQKDAEEAPRRMRERQQAIHARIERIETEKQNATLRVFKAWYPDCQRLIRPRETGLFNVLLDGLQDFFFRTQNEAGMDGMGLFNIGDVEGLTADASSPAWQCGLKWYGGRR